MADMSPLALPWKPSFAIYCRFEKLASINKESWLSLANRELETIQYFRKPPFENQV